jgi:hypothetical protein
MIFENDKRKDVSAGMMQASETEKIQSFPPFDSPLATGVLSCLFLTKVPFWFRGTRISTTEPLTK